MNQHIEKDYGEYEKSRHWYCIMKLDADKLRNDLKPWTKYHNGWQDSVPCKVVQSFTKQLNASVQLYRFLQFCASRTFDMIFQNSQVSKRSWNVAP